MLYGADAPYLEPHIIIFIMNIAAYAHVSNHVAKIIYHHLFRALVALL